MIRSGGRLVTLISGAGNEDCCLAIVGDHLPDVVGHGIRDLVGDSDILFWHNHADGVRRERAAQDGVVTHLWVYRIGRLLLRLIVI